MIRNRISVSTIAGVSAMIVANSALANGHTWKVNEVFSTADGSIQFIELRECCGGALETGVNGQSITSIATGNVFTFSSNLTAPTSNKHILLATTAFAALPGAPTPDHIIPANFFSLTGETLQYWIYDAWAITAGTVPIDCVNSLDRNSGVGVNSPTNYAGATGQIDAWPGRIADLNSDNVVDTADLGILIGEFGTAGVVADLNNDGTVDTADLGILIGLFGSSCP